MIRFFILSSIVELQSEEASMPILQHLRHPNSHCEMWLLRNLALSPQSSL